MSFLTDLEAKVQSLWERLRDDEHPAAAKAEEILTDVKTEAENAGKTIETDAEPVAEEVGKVAETTVEQAVATVATDVAKDA